MKGMDVTIKWTYFVHSNFTFYVQVLNGATDMASGGAIIFMTDGQQDCRNGGYDIDDRAVTDRIKKTKVRIITVAFG